MDSFKLLNSWDVLTRLDYICRGRIIQRELETLQMLFQYLILNVQRRFVCATKKHFRSGRFV